MLPCTAVLYKNIRDAQPNDPKPPEIKLSADLLPGKSFVFPSLSLDMGGWEVSTQQEQRISD